MPIQSVDSQPLIHQHFKRTVYLFLAPWNFFWVKKTWTVIVFSCSVLQQNPKLHWKPILSVCSTEMIFLELNPKHHYIISRKQDREIKISYSKRKGKTSKKSIVLASWLKQSTITLFRMQVKNFQNTFISDLLEAQIYSTEKWMINCSLFNMGLFSPLCVLSI